MTISDLRISHDVPSAFATLIASEMASRDKNQGSIYALGCSGGSSGENCFARLAREPDIAWEAVALFFVDERCVPVGTPESNQTVIANTLGERCNELHSFHPMNCEEGTASYDALYPRRGSLDAIQLGFGPDGHVASLFPHSPALSAPAGQLVATNIDPSGNNPHKRLTLTFEAIAQSPLVIFTVIGAEKAMPFRQVADGEDLPAGRVHAQRIIWLSDVAAAAELPRSLRG